MGHLGIDRAAAAAVFSAIAAASLAGTFLAGVLGDRVPVRPLLTLGQISLASAMLWSFVITAPWQAFVCGGLLGLTSGFASTLQALVWPTYFGRRSIGSIRSAAATGTIAAAAIGPLPFGWLVDVTGSYRETMLLFLVAPVLSGLAARPPRK